MCRGAAPFAQARRARRCVIDGSGKVKKDLKFLVLIVSKFFGQDGRLAADEQKLLLRGQGSHFVRRKECPGGVLLGMVAEEVPAGGFCFVDHRGLPGEVGDELGAFIVGDAKELQHPRVGKEGSSQTRLTLQLMIQASR